VIDCPIPDKPFDYSKLVPKSGSLIPERDRKAVILVVDDEPLVRNVVQMTLIHAGYHVLTASDGAEAVDVSRTYPGPIDLVVSDVKMPNITGLELAAMIVKERTGIHVLLMTGKSSGAIPPHLLPDLLRKPFFPKQLLERIHQVLAEPREPS
jgi:two-component system, cell cycle sensor histidine kinase and response regulator CckA